MSTTEQAGEVISDAARGYLRLALVGDVGPVRAAKLVAHFGSLEAVFGASRSELKRVEGIGEQIAGRIFSARGDDGVEREITRAQACGLRILCPEDSDYPRPLVHTPDPPMCLYVRGTLERTDAVSVAIVGTRRCSHYGSEQAQRFGEVLASAGFTVVSGLARGVDSWAHRGALRAGGRTLAVLGNGLATIYPREHEQLAAEIAEHGAVLSELPVDIVPDSKNFPRRNRIVAGLSLGVLVVEAGRTSGALITARHAVEYNREVFAIPGRIDRPELTAGVNGLIRDGCAKLVTSLDDLLDDLSQVGEIMRRGLRDDERDAESAVAAHRHARLEAHEQSIIEAVRHGATRVDAICDEANLDAGTVVAALTKLQIQGFLRRLPGDCFELCASR